MQKGMKNWPTGGGELTLEMAELRVGLGPAFFAPKRRFMLSGEDSEIGVMCFVLVQSLNVRYGFDCWERFDA